MNIYHIIVLAIFLLLFLSCLAYDIHTDDEDWTI
jgi:hypothetical protein